MKPSHTRPVLYSFLAGGALAILYLCNKTPVPNRPIPLSRVQPLTPISPVLDQPTAEHLDSSTSTSPVLYQAGFAEGPGSSPQVSSSWQGWDHIENMVVFGDSVTTTHFLVDHEQPSEINPMGNPPWPGLPTANGPNWVGWLTSKYNATFLRTVNLAYGGATIDKTSVRPSAPDAMSFKEQLRKVWLPNYVPANSKFDWKPHNTLFVSWMGNNDVRDALTWNGANTAPVLETDLIRYSEHLDQLYKTGARNILIMDVMPLERAPMIARNETGLIQEMRELVQAFNRNLTRMVSTFSDTHPDAKIMEYDTYDLFNRVLNDHCSFEETCPLKQLTNYCHQYRLERHDSYKFDERCNFSADQYFWLSPNHPNFRVHDALAKDIARYLDSVT